MISRKHNGWLWSGFSLILTLSFLFPIYWMLVSSMKTDAEIFTIPATLLPAKFTLKNYVDVLSSNYSVSNSFLNSFLTAMGTSILGVLLALPASYALARYRFRGKAIMTVLFLVSQMMPPTLTLVPLYLMFIRMKLINSLLGVIFAIVSSTVPLSVMIMRTYYLNIPKELEEAARIDGCGVFRTFIQIILPVASTGAYTIAVFAFIAGWNNLIYPMTFITKSYKWPATAMLYSFNNEYGLQWNLVMTYSMLLILPLLLIFIFLQKYMVVGLAEGSVKG
jgi:multiple sugar transport system permease protein